MGGEHAAGSRRSGCVDRMLCGDDALALGSPNHDQEDAQAQNYDDDDEDDVMVERASDMQTLIQHPLVNPHTPPPL